MAKYSKIQLQVLSLYREFLQVSEGRPGLKEFVRSEFKKNAMIPRTDSLHIEAIYRRGQRQLELLKKKEVNSIGMLTQAVKTVTSLAKIETGSVFSRIFSMFPDGIQMAFAYGSGVFQQQGQDMSKNMLDLILVVDDPILWHKKNLNQNRKHYSIVKYFGPRNISTLQNSCGGIYFNTLIPFEERLIKYGVISTNRLVVDLLDWDALYVSGRLHKPVQLIIDPTSQELMKAMAINLQNALHASLLMLPELFTEEQLFLKITSLSYNGDFRMTIGEDKNKIQNIVTPNIERFRHLYEHFLESEEHVFWNKSKGILEQYPNHVAQFHHLNLLPKEVLKNLVKLKYHYLTNIPDTEEVIRLLAHDSHCKEFVERSIANIVYRTSMTQTLKTAFTAGLAKSVRYSWAKFKKMMKSTRKGTEKIN
ncbi:hypothetical protein CHS0354_036024 [Potamilus streckersoni]|uniref:Phosphatidate cytidylyltransferase, mitochondrial n=1 Tax=Potamilus streckersoni TaxID=2493646 RepID=A0AAE0RMS8_9BIVA|nr:hypothetical protein CHS0354_036024 [Potamilus streckersoni]